jgi:hypothetical protein
MVLVAGVAFADDESDRNDIVRNIDDKVDKVASEVYGFDGDSDDRDMDDAMSISRDLKDLVSKLDRVKGSDSRAGSIVSYYPRYIDDFSGAARWLRKMKEIQYQANGVASKCNGEESALQSTIRNYVGNPDDADEALEKLPELGKALGRTWEDKMKRLREADRDMQNAASNAQFSVSTDKWSSVSSNVSNVRSAMQRHWSDNFNPADAACKRLELGERHPDIEKAIAELSKHRGGVKGTVTQLKRDYNQWLREVRALRKFSDEDRDALRNALCAAGEYEMEAKVKAQA